MLGRFGSSSPTGGSSDPYSPESTSLFDRYATGSGSRSKRSPGNMGTRTSRLRATGVKLACYLNTECDRGRATIIQLPEDCDTMGEVLPKIQARMQLDNRMLYASELFLPDGTKIHTYRQLIDVASKHTAIIVGCGEPFDPSTVPYDILEFHLHGGGRAAAMQVKKELHDKRLLDAHEKADGVRASGHGVYPNSVAVVTARSQTVENNRQQAAHMRHEYMEQLMFRASQQKELIDRVRENNMVHKMEHYESKMRRKASEEARLAKLTYDKQEMQRVAKEKKAASRARILLYHNKIKQDYQHSSMRLRHQKLARISKFGSMGDEVRL